MANPRQRRKSRSSSHKTVSHSKRAQKLLKKTPTIRANKILQEAWDSQKTVRQNYQAIGLAHTLDPLQTGGEECHLEYVHPSQRSDSKDTSSTSTKKAARGAPTTGPAASTSSTSDIPKGCGRIVRDSSGNVISVEVKEDPREEDGSPERDEDDEMDAEPEVDEKTLELWAAAGSRSHTGDAKQEEGRQKIIKALEELSSSTASKLPRYSSNGEKAYLKRLAAKYGGDYEEMARDRRLNTDQRTAGELKRAMKKVGVHAQGS